MTVLGIERLCLRSIAVCLIVAISMSVVVGQESFVPISPRETARYRIDFARVFFANPETEKRDYAELYAAFESLENLKTRVTDSAANLELALQFLKIDLNDPKLIAYAMTVIEAKVKLIEAIYNEPGYSK